MATRRPGKLLFKLQVHGIEWSFRMVSRPKLQALYAEDDGVEVQGFMERETHTVYVANDLGNELPVIIVHELNHIVWAGPQSGDEWVKRLKCLPDEKDDIEEAVISVTTPILVGAMKQVPRKYLGL